MYAANRSSQSMFKIKKETCPFIMKTDDLKV